MIDIYQNNERQHIAVNTVNIVPLTNTTGIWAGISDFNLPCIATIDYSDPTDIKYINTIYGSYNTDTDEFINIDGCPDLYEHGPLVCVGLTSSGNRSVFAALVSGELLEYYDEYYRYNKEKYYTFELSGESIYDNIFIVKIEDGVGTLAFTIPLSPEVLGSSSDDEDAWYNPIFVEDFKYIGHGTYAIKIFVGGSVNRFFYYQIVEPISEKGCAASPELVSKLINDAPVRKHSSLDTRFGAGTDTEYGHTKVATDFVATAGAHSLYTTLLEPTTPFSSYPTVEFFEYDGNILSKLWYSYGGYHDHEVGTLEITDKGISILDRYSIPEEYKSSECARPVVTQKWYNDKNNIYVTLFKYSDPELDNLIVSFNRYESGNLTELSTLEIPLAHEHIYSSECIIPGTYSDHFSVALKLTYGDSFADIIATCNLSDNPNSYYIVNDVDATHIKDDGYNIYLYNHNTKSAIRLYYSNGNYTKYNITSTLSNLNIQSNLVDRYSNTNQYCLVYNENSDSYTLRSLDFSSAKITSDFVLSIPREYLSSYSKCDTSTLYVKIYKLGYSHLLIDHRFIIDTNTGEISYNYIPELSQAMINDNPYVASALCGYVNDKYFIFQHNHDDDGSIASIHVCSIQDYTEISDGTTINASLVTDIKKDQERLNLVTRIMLENKADIDHRSEYSDKLAASTNVYGHVKLVDQITGKTDNEHYELGLVPSINAMIDYVEEKIGSEPSLNIVESIIDPSLSTIFMLNVVNDTEININTLPTNKVYKEFTLFLTNAGNFNVVLPDNVLLSDGFYPSFTKDGTDVLKFTTIDGGNTWFCQQIGQNIH